MSSSDMFRHHASKWCTDIPVDKIPLHINVAQIIKKKNPETDIRIQAERSEKQSNQPLESSYLYESFRLKSEFLSQLALYSFLVVILKVCITTARPLWLTGVAVGIKGVCLPFMADYSG